MHKRIAMVGAALAAFATSASALAVVNPLSLKSSRSAARAYGAT